MIYKLFNGEAGSNIGASVEVSSGVFHAFLFSDQANTDYQTFKAQILADEAQLQDADGNTMSAEDAKQFVSTLP